MKILHINHSIIIGGTERVICGLINEQSKRHDVTLCTWYGPKPGEGLETRISDRVKRVSLYNEKMDFITKLKDEIKLYKIIKDGDYDVVHVHNNFNFYILAVLLLKDKVRFFYTIHSDAVRENGPLSSKTLKIKSLFFKKKWLVPITISPQSQQSFKKLYHCESYMQVNGIEQPKVEKDDLLLEKYRLTRETRIFVHVGRICEAKNQEVLCKVFKRLISEGNDVVLLIIGPREIESIWEVIKEYFSDRICYLGSRDDAISFFRMADAMCLPSIYEGLPITLLESLAVGCIPICSPVGGIPSVIEDGYNGFLSESSSEEDYYDAVKRFLKKPIVTIDSIKTQVQKTFEKYDISQTAIGYEKIYMKEIIKLKKHEFCK